MRRVERVTIVGDTPYHDPDQPADDHTPYPFRGQLSAFR
jgi:hypothetical protein